RTIRQLAAAPWAQTASGRSTSGARFDYKALFLRLKTTFRPGTSYTTHTQTTLGLVSESTYDWERDQWSVAVIPQVGQLFKLGPQILQLAVGAKYWAEAPENGPEGWGLRVLLTLLFPR
ncbi:hypothetical protein, partial [Thiococcus pfennigii]|uniref:hypothetical protein n=1 Tax=Thiococcus pfennigii TaxID=1057 RepID=UPI001A914E00